MIILGGNSTGGNSFTYFHREEKVSGVCGVGGALPNIIYCKYNLFIFIKYIVI
jgi:hypothetical protein